MKFYFNSSETNEAMSAKDKFVTLYGQNKAENADIIVPIGGDGFLLKNLHLIYHKFYLMGKIEKIYQYLYKT